jgi:hypothetical protein
MIDATSMLKVPSSQPRSVDGKPESERAKTRAFVVTLGFEMDILRGEST